MSKLAVLIVGGAWHTADYLQPLAQTFQAVGHETETVPLPSAGASPPTKDFSGDVAAIRRAAESLIAEGKDVLAVIHSVGSIPGTEALHGLGKRAGAAGVVAIVYIASHVPAKGHDFGQHLASVGDVTWAPARANFAKVGRFIDVCACATRCAVRAGKGSPNAALTMQLFQDGMIGFPPEFAKSMFYNDLEEKEAQHWSALLVPQSLGVYDSPLTHDTYNEIPIGYIACEQDQAYKYTYQLQNIADRGFPANRVLKMNTGQTPWLTTPTEVREFALKIAADVWTSTQP